MTVATVARRRRALAEVTAVGLAYIAISIGLVASVDLSAVFPQNWSAAERTIGSGFLIGAFVQLVLVLAGAYLLRLPDMKAALAATLAPSSRSAWIVAGAATAIHVATAVAAFMPQAHRIGEASSANLLLSIIPAADGFTQEVVFRGYVLFRLAKAGISNRAQIAISGLLFAAIHVGYFGGGLLEAVWPFVGTLTLGCFYAWSVQLGRGSLKPAVLCHVALILIVQPWLAYAQ